MLYWAEQPQISDQSGERKACEERSASAPRRPGTTGSGPYAVPTSRGARRCPAPQTIVLAQRPRGPVSSAGLGAILCLACLASMGKFDEGATRASSGRSDELPANIVGSTNLGFSLCHEGETRDDDGPW